MESSQGSTIAGNLTVIGAASNVIIVQAAESQKKKTFSFFEFARIGLPLTATNAAISVAGAEDGLTILEGAADGHQEQPAFQQVDRSDLL